MDRVSLDAVISSMPSIMVGYSGGVDSALVAATARRILGPDRVLGVLGVSASLAEGQREQAHRVARQFDIPVVEVSTAELADPRYRANPTNRCYFCKHELWTVLGREAARRGFAVVADGTNADDVRGHRPGRAAAAEQGVRSPLLEAGLGKQDVRAAARRIGLPIWDAPSAPCLASRVRYGLEVTPERLEQVERGEAYLRQLGIDGDLRVRHYGAEARIETRPDAFPAVRRARAEIVATFSRLGFTRVTLDREGYRSGSLLRPTDDVELLTV